MKRAALITLGLLLCSAPVYAQPIESEPLPAPYTMQGETDPMALGGAPGPVPVQEAPINRGETIIAPPPPGADSITTYESTPITAETPPPSNEAYPSGIEQNPGNTQAAYPANAPSANQYPNNAVSGVVPQDESKFENKMFCTMKISFGSACCGPDNATGEKVKSYLDENAAALTYVRTNWGKEGEYSYCVKVTDPKKQAEIYTKLKKTIEANPVKNKPVIMSGKFDPVGTKAKILND